MYPITTAPLPLGWLEVARADGDVAVVPEEVGEVPEDVDVVPDDAAVSELALR